MGLLIACLGRGPVSFIHLGLVCRKRSQNLVLLPLGHLGEVKRAG
jgi:hypothetical protein